MNEFDERAATWDDDPAKWRRAEDVAAAIRRRVDLTPATAALDYGCGTGLLGFALRHDVGTIDLADSSQGMLDAVAAKIAATGAAGMRPLRYDIVTDPLPPSRYDLVVSAMTLHHLPDTEAALRTFAALLRDEAAVLCLADLDAEDGSFHSGRSDLHHGFDRDLLRVQAGRAGFGSVDFETVHEVEREANGERRRYTVFLMVARPTISGVASGCDRFIAERPGGPGRRPQQSPEEQR